MLDYVEGDVDSGLYWMGNSLKLSVPNKRLEGNDLENGKFRFSMKLEDIFGFAKDYNC